MTDMRAAVSLPKSAWCQPAALKSPEFTRFIPIEMQKLTTQPARPPSRPMLPASARKSARMSRT